MLSKLFGKKKDVKPKKKLWLVVVGNHKMYIKDEEKLKKYENLQANNNAVNIVIKKVK